MPERKVYPKITAKLPLYPTYRTPVMSKITTIPQSGGVFTTQFPVYAIEDDEEEEDLKPWDILNTSDLQKMDAMLVKFYLVFFASTYLLNFLVMR
jgi:hypothetical protein